jgi:hypothetical protein
VYKGDIQIRGIWNNRLILQTGSMQRFSSNFRVDWMDQITVDNNERRESNRRPDMEAREERVK